MPNITQKHIEACYDVGKKFYAEDISRKDGVIELIDVHKMNSRGSAEMYIEFFRYCMNGKRLVPAVSAACLEYYLKNVLEDYGKKQLETFLQGLKLHIEHHKSKGKSKKSFCDLYNEYSKEI